MTGALSMDDFNRPEGALQSVDSENPSDYSSVTAASPQEMRDLQALAYAKGLNAPTRTGSSTETYGNAADARYQLALESMKENAALRQKLAAIATSKNLSKEIAREQAQNRLEVARMQMGAKSERMMDDDELKDAGLPPGTSASINNFGKVRILNRPPSSQTMITGFDKEGKPVYSSPDAALTPKLRTDYQTYLRQATQVTPQLEQILKDLSSKEAQTSMGVSGGAERLLEATAGQTAGLFGRTKPLFPKDASLRNRIQKLNEMLLPTLEADPRHQAMGARGKDVLKEMLPDPSSMWQDVGTAKSKLEDLKKQIEQRRDEYSAALKGTPSGTSDNASVPPPPNPDQINAAMVRQHAKEAIAKGKPHDAVARAAKERYNVDIDAED